MRASTAPPMIGEIRPLVVSFGRHLRASNLAPRTIHSYQEADYLLASFPEARGDADRANRRRGSAVLPL